MSNIVSNYNLQISSILFNIFKDLIKSEQDRNKIKKMYELLENRYRIVDTTNDDVNNLISSGSFIYYIKYNFNNVLKIGFTNSGFVTDDDNNYIKIYNYNKYWKIKKQNYVIFKKMSQNELFRIQLNQLYNN